MWHDGSLQRKLNVVALLRKFVRAESAFALKVLFGNIHRSIEYDYGVELILAKAMMALRKLTR